MTAPAAVEAAPAADLLARVIEVRGLFPHPEARKFAVRKAAAQVLAEFEALENPPPELAMAVTKLLRRMRKPARALAILERHGPAPGKEREFEFLRMALLISCGRTAEGLQLLPALEREKLRPSWKRHVAKIRKKHSDPQSGSGLKEMERETQRLACVPAVGTHLPVLKARFAAGNHALELLAFVQGRTGLLASITAPADGADLSVFDKYHVASLVFTCGFNWSGSGAVTCYLRQHKDVALPFGMSEIGPLQGKGRSNKGFFVFLDEGPLTLGAMKRRMARFLTVSLACLSSRKNGGPLKQICGAEDARLLVLGRLVDDFIRLMLSQPALDSAEARRPIIARFLERLLSLRGGSTLVLNNVLVAANLELLPYMAHSRFVVVQRDVRDQFIARKFESRDPHKQGLDVVSFERVVAENRRRFEAMRRASRRLGTDERLLFIRFEDFVRDEAVRREVLAFLRLDRRRMTTDLAAFDPDASARNIGIHQAHATPEEIDFLQTRMGVYLPQDLEVPA
ncbi:MAG: hypothetical protein ACO1PB_15505 [Ramlibacter sp.]